MRLDFENKWALILGASSGLGLATAKKLAAHGMNLILIHRDRKVELDKLEETYAVLRDHGIRLLIFNENALDAEVRHKILTEVKLQLGQQKIFTLIHSIAKGNLKKLYSDTEPTADKSDFDITIHAMATSWWEWTKALIDLNLWNSDARNLSFTSEGNQRYIPNYVVVSAAKASLEVLNRYMAVELAPLGIKTNLIQSGVVETPSMKMIPGSDKIIELTQKRNPFKRLTQPEDIANMVYLLCLPEAAWMNGAVVKVDGGETL